MKEKSIDELIKDKLFEGYTKKPILLLSRDVHRVFQDIGEDNYLGFMQNFVEDVHILVGKNMPALCDRIADEILRHLEARDDTDSNDNASPG